MTLEFIGTIPPHGPARDTASMDPGYVAACTRAHVAAGFDRAAVGADVAALVARSADQLGLLVAHRPDPRHPEGAARALAELDDLSGGRAALHLATDDHDGTDPDAHYQRIDDYLGALKAVWEAEGTTVRPLRRPRIGIVIDGTADAAIPVVGRHADIYGLWGHTVEQVRRITGRVRPAAALSGRGLRFALAFRPIIAATEEAAWDSAERILGPVAPLRRPRVADAFAARVDRRLHIPAQRPAGAPPVAALVGTPEQVAAALLDYSLLGVTTFIVRGFDPLRDADDITRELVPATRRLLAERTATHIHAAE